MVLLVTKHKFLQESKAISYIPSIADHKISPYVALPQGEEQPSFWFQELLIRQVSEAPLISWSFYKLEMR